MQVEVLVLLIAIFMGPINDEGDQQFPLYVFQNLTFSGKESCNQYITENKNKLWVYLSGQYNTLPNVYFSRNVLFYCVSTDWKKRFSN